MQGRYSGRIQLFLWLKYIKSYRFRSRKCRCIDVLIVNTFVCKIGLWLPLIIPRSCWDFSVNHKNGKLQLIYILYDASWFIIFNKLTPHIPSWYGQIEYSAIKMHITVVCLLVAWHCLHIFVVQKPKTVFEGLVTSMCPTDTDVWCSIANSAIVRVFRYRHHEFSQDIAKYHAIF